MFYQDVAVQIKEAGLKDGSGGGRIHGPEGVVIGHILGDAARVEF